MLTNWLLIVCILGVAISLLNSQETTPSDCGPHEMFECRNPCGSTCSTQRVQCPALNETCQCFCENRYAFDQQNQCVPIDSDKCKVISQPKPCERGELWDCRSTNDANESDELCADDDSCTGGCYCLPKYVRNSQGKCVPTKGK